MGSSAETAASLRREARLALLVGAGAVIAVLALFGALLAAGAAAPAVNDGVSANSTNLAQQLHDFHHAHSLQALALGLKALAFVMVLPVAAFLHGASRRRHQTAPGWVLVLGALGVVLTVGSSAWGFAALSHVATQFVHHGPQTVKRAHHLAASSGGLRASAVIEQVARVVFAIWLGAASYIAMQVGLLTRFLGALGIGAAVAWALLIPGGEALFFVWLAAMAALALDRFPGGRPEGWRSGHVRA